MGTREYEIRRPVLEEAPTIAALHVATWRETYGRLLPDGFFTAEHSRLRQEQWQRALADPDDLWGARVARVDGALVGFAVAGPAEGVGGTAPPRDRQLYNLYVIASRHGAGVGQALFDEVLGVAPAMLWVAGENPRAIAFYRRNGFDFDGAEFVDPSAPGLLHLRMVR